ncbi:hypothetical protein LTR49_028710 [Elasticomyces elasticus]|nr:hypothetical protein LTR49_028710 [Elasticomyces elasticus]
MSGVHTIPFVCLYALGAIPGEVTTSKTWFLLPLEIVSALVTPSSSGLPYALDTNTSEAWYIGAQIPFGFSKATGLGNQVPVAAPQAFFNPGDTAATIRIIFTWQTISGA